MAVDSLGKDQITQTPQGFRLKDLTAVVEGSALGRMKMLLPACHQRMMDTVKPYLSGGDAPKLVVSGATLVPRGTGFALNCLYSIDYGDNVLAQAAVEGVEIPLELTEVQEQARRRFALTLEHADPAFSLCEQWRGVGGVIPRNPESNYMQALSLSVHEGRFQLPTQGNIPDSIRALVEGWNDLPEFQELIASVGGGTRGELPDALVPAAVDAGELFEDLLLYPERLSSAGQIFEGLSVLAIRTLLRGAVASLKGGVLLSDGDMSPYVLLQAEALVHKARPDAEGREEEHPDYDCIGAAGYLGGGAVESVSSLDEVPVLKLDVGQFGALEFVSQIQLIKNIRRQLVAQLKRVNIALNQRSEGEGVLNFPPLPSLPEELSGLGSETLDLSPGEELYCGSSQVVVLDQGRVEVRIGNATEGTVVGVLEAGQFPHVLFEGLTDGPRSARVLANSSVRARRLQLPSFDDEENRLKVEIALLEILNQKIHRALYLLEQNDVRETFTVEIDDPESASGRLRDAWAAFAETVPTFSRWASALTR